jgi:hypothetical protein
MDKLTCGAKTRAGGACRNPAGFKTDHPGAGKCWLHGGATPIKHGRYSSIQRPRLRELLEQFEADPAPLDLLPEVKLIRALLVDFVERYDEFVNAMHAWHASYTSSYREAFSEWRERVIALTEDGRWRDIEPQDLPPAPDPLDYVDKPRQVLDISAAATLADKVGAMVDRIEKHKQTSTITLETLNRVIEQMGVEVVQAAAKEVSSDVERSALLDAIERRWADVRLDTSAPTRTPPSQGNLPN